MAVVAIPLPQSPVIQWHPKDPLCRAAPEQDGVVLQWHSWVTTAHLGGNDMEGLKQDSWITEAQLDCSDMAGLHCHCWISAIAGSQLDVWVKMA